MEAYNMQTEYHICCGLDVHKDSIVACILKTINITNNDENGKKIDPEIKTFKTFPDDLNTLKNWLESENCRHVAMESTGVYWFPVYAALEDAFEGEIELLVANARHMKNVPGKKTDINDAEWIASLHRAGLLSGSFIPPQEIRELRDLTRYRASIVHDINSQKNRIEKTLQMSGIKLSTILTDPHGVSARNLVDVFINKGYITPKDVDIETRSISKEKKADLKRILTVKLNEHKRNFLKMQTEQLSSLEAHLVEIEQSIMDASAQYNEEIQQLDSIPGIAETSATAIIAEIGTDMSKFKTAEHFCSWAGLSPGNHESAGKKKVHASLMETPI
jgi:transposase